ncbi:MAG TPA: hypothetical protein VML19_28155 [Verrucomicrobiae bacterium]|nr:hypothetical protein [Verrucomicrobiae bacterium]
MSHGPIAVSYDELQGLPFLRKARPFDDISRASPESILRTVYQCADLVLFNLADLMGRAAAEVSAGRFGAAMVKLAWSRSFHGVLTKLSLLPLGFAPVAPKGKTVSIADSPALAEFLGSLRRFDSVLRGSIESGGIDPRQLLRTKSLDDSSLQLIRLATICRHEATIWESHLNRSLLWTGVGYQQAIAPGLLRQAVYCSVLDVDNFLLQFRVMHQVQELLGEEVNDRLELAVRMLREGKVDAAADLTGEATRILDPILACLAPLVDNLAASDYHKIRTYLGLTSGGHSVNLHFYLLTDIYEQFSDEVTNYLENTTESGDGGSTRLANAARQLRGLLLLWRDQHVHLPRNNLGGLMTRSLVGSSDALQAVHTMRSKAIEADRLKLPGETWAGESPGSIQAYERSAESLDDVIMAAAGSVTQEEFPEVQARTGFFSHSCPFVRPPFRKI